MKPSSLLVLLLSGPPPHRTGNTPSQHEFFQPQPQQQFQFVPELFQQLPADPEIDSSLRHDGSTSTDNPKKRTYALVVTYYGPNFPGGYEWNPDVTLTTVRETLTRAIEASLAATVGDHHRRIQLQTAGRTDARVSAKSNVFSFVSRRDSRGGMLLERNLNEFRKDLNQRLNDTRMHVRQIQRVDDRFHATFSTHSRQYLYVLPLHYSLDSNEAQSYADALQDTLQSVAVDTELDYKALSSGAIRTRDSLCTIQSATVTHWSPSSSVPDPVPGFTAAWEMVTSQPENSGSCKEYPHCLVFSIRANRFLKRMMRKLINGILLDHHHAKDNDGRIRFRERLDSRDRSGNHPAPSEGLCLWRVWTSLSGEGEMLDQLSR